MRKHFQFSIFNFQFFICLLVIVAISCQQRPSEASNVTASPPEQTAASPTADTMAPPVSTPAAPATDPGTEAARRITLEEATAALNRGDAVLVDVRSPVAYQESHARGAVNIPEDQIINRIADIPMGKMIITYCT